MKMKTAKVSLKVALKVAVAVGGVVGQAVGELSKSDNNNKIENENKEK